MKLRQLRRRPRVTRLGARQAKLFREPASLPVLGMVDQFLTNLFVIRSLCSRQITIAARSPLENVVEFARGVG